ncbi:phosphotransferase enzyme family protein [Alteribacillus sp. HJP-4]|uniref:phosphotransferase enzyme family protein n=1 Tax=Alteribacillus sp. HJP-4 TaxID=2775394 RepID=UPI0035CCDA70
MEQWIEELFTDELLIEAAGRYGAAVSKSEKLGDFENYVFEVHINDTPYILRLTHSSHRSKAAIEAEIDWVNFLHSHDINVSLVHPSRNGELVEVIPAGDTSFFVCLFEKAPGQRVKISDELFGPELFEKWGKITASMHSVSMDYQPGASRREDWLAEDLHNLPYYLDQQKDKEIISGGKQIVNSINAMPKTKETFGLIHADIHPGNFFYHDGEIHVFDFDDSVYFYYVSDIAIPIYYSVWIKHSGSSLEERSRFGEELLYHFLKGYKTILPLDPDFIKKIPLFLRLRDYDLYAVFHKKWDVATLGEKEQQLLARIRNRLVTGELVAEINYDRLLSNLSR